MVNENEIKDMLSEILETDVNAISEDALFVEDLGMDSLRVLEILAELEKKYSIQIPPERLTELKDVRGTIAVAKEICEAAQ